MQPIWSLGLMSGTSLDGIDGALIRTDGVSILEVGPGLTVPYHKPMRVRLKEQLGNPEPNPSLEEDLTRLHALVVKKLVKKIKHPVGLIGFHGQTIYHAPPQTLQMGDGALLARLTGIPVVYDFRFEDCRQGGQGAPLVPVYHQALCAKNPTFAEEPTVILNIGGVANVTYCHGEELSAFDTGPGNALIDDFMMREMKQPYDLGGKIASFGKPHINLLQKWLEDPYFQKAYPKSLDRDYFQYLLQEVKGQYGGIDGLATLTAFTSFSVFHGIQKLPQMPKHIIVCGGGRKNKTILHWLRFLMKHSKVLLSDEMGWDGDLVEAQAFAYLAVRSKRGLALSYPNTTGVRKPTTGGKYVAE